MKKSNLIRSVVFILLVGVLVYGLCDIFEYNNDHIRRRFNTYDKFEKDTVDVAFVGTSGLDRYWLASKAFDESGITAYPFTSEGTPSWLYISMLKQVTKKQSPKVIVFDMRPFVLSYDTGKLDDVYSRKVIDCLNFFSFSRFDAISRTLKVFREYDDDTSGFDPSYFFSFIKYHNMWEDSMSFDELKEPESPYLGFYLHNTLSIKCVGTVAKDVVTDNRAPLDELCKAQLYEVLDYVKDKDYAVLFLDTAHAHTTLEAERTNTICDILDEYGVKYYIDAYSSDLYDLGHDFYNDGHANFYGAEKFTEHFQKYLLENYDLPDHRDDEKCQSWHGVYNKIKRKISALELV